jgi:predicted GIY-YIG superfamily endonuclease
MDTAWVYILRCSDGSYYTGKTQVSIECRLWQHQHGVYGGYTSARRPVTLVWSQGFPTYIEAITMERRIKGWSRAKKEALINGDYNLLHVLSECRNASNYTKKK